MTINLRKDKILSRGCSVHGLVHGQKERVHELVHGHYCISNKKLE